MPQSVCIEQIEGYVRNRGDRASFSVEDDGAAIEVRVPMNRLVTKEGHNTSPIRISVSEQPCGIVLTMPEVYHPHGFTAVNHFPKKIGHRSSGLRPFPYTMTAEYDQKTLRLDLTMTVPAVGPSVTQAEFYEAVSAFVQIADRWAARVQRPPEPKCDDNESGPLNNPIGGGPDAQ